jgi:small subunit ribosomal protein S21|tara:strand:+ start:309 stop:494 length:186 start_codon:yes stop_codon:yes gene_type:complete
MLIIKVKNGKIDPALKAFKNKVRKTKQLQKIREDKYFTKKSVKKRLTKQKAVYKEQHIIIK